MKKFPVAVQVYSVRDDAAADFRGTLEKIKAMGYDGVEFAGLYGNDPADVKKMCEEIGLVPVSAHVPLVELVNATEKTVADYVSIGCKYIAVPYLGEEDRPGTPNWEKTVANIKMIGEECKKQGIKLLYHNHDFEFVKLGDTYALDMLYDTVSADLLATELDTCWVNVGGENPAGYVRKYADRAPVVHLKDFVGAKSDDMYELIGIEKKVTAAPAFELRPVGYGCQDWYNILKACEDAGTEWVVVEQDRPSMGKTPLESIEMSRKYLTTLGN
ncbi:MAG: sugar phosphate isomerase/epimerase [Clostridia bacterium]|nr:sugar phosphate isomerase/epimerase [Clostridia bacterium]